MSLERDVLRRDRRRRLWPSLFVIAIVIWAIADFIFTSLARPEALPSRRMIERRSLHGHSLPMDPPSLARQIFKAILEDEDALHRLKNDTWEHHLSDEMDPEAAEKLTALVRLMIGHQVEYAPCTQDASLDPIPSHINDIFVASNLKNNEQILPNFIKHLMLFILSHPERTFFISMYESGSTDGTASILTAFSDVLEVLAIEHVIQYNGTLTRRRRQPRIEFLSTVRNAAIQPLINDPQPHRWDRILFINDVMFCTGDLHRLLLHDGDIVCGLDFVRTIEKPSRKSRKRGTEVVDIKRQYYSERLNAIVQEATNVVPSARRWDHQGTATVINLATSEPPSAKAWMDFYDIWVSHDINGRHFKNNHPFVKNNSYSDQRLQNGLPFPVECCWNGAAVLNPEPFLKHGVQFRSALDGECRTSECVLLCHDFQRLGYTKVVIDPSVWLTYTLKDLQMLELTGINGIRRVDWKTVKSAEPMIDRRFQVNATVDCCSILKHKDVVDFKRCKSDYNFWKVSSALEHLGLTGRSQAEWNRTK